MADIECCYFECTFTFQNVDELEWHLAEDHHKCYSYQCEQCYLSRRPSLFPTQAGRAFDTRSWTTGPLLPPLVLPEIDRKREKIQRDLDKCLKQSDKEFSSSHIEVKVLCEREVQTEQVHQEKEQTKQTVQLREKVPYLPPEIAVIKVEPEDVEIIAIKSNGKSSYNGSAGQQLQPIKRQLDEELRNEISASRTQSTGSNDSMPCCPVQTANIRPGGPLIKKLKRVEEIVDTSRAADPRLRSQYFQSIPTIIPDMLAISKPAATADIDSPKKDLPFHATSITIKLNNESKVSSEEDTNELDDSWMHSSHSSRELSKEVEVEIDTVDCAICGMEVENKPVNNLLHINSCHLRYELYTCRQCKRPFYGAWEEALDHLNHDHPTTLASLDSHHSVLLKDYSTTYFPKIAKTMKRYFPGQGAKFENWKSLQGQHPSKKK